jgi:pantetheine-phosphate adenylyltransferase
VIPFRALATDLAREKRASVIVRGIRAVSDFDYEFQMAGMNRQLNSGIETVFLTPAENLACTTSSLVREIASLHGDVSLFVDSIVVTALKNKFS